jgi:hypothetical protein
MKMKNWKKIMVSGILLLVILGGMATAKGPSKQAGKSDIAHIYLFEKDPITWEIVENGAWGKMKYNLEGATFDFVFNGHNLTPDYSYTLIYYPDRWPGNDLICLGTEMANDEGNVHIKGSIDTGDMLDAKIWLVLSSDVDCENAMMIRWNPTEYLFEYDLITFVDTGE